MTIKNRKLIKKLKIRKTIRKNYPPKKYTDVLHKYGGNIKYDINNYMLDLFGE
jgi:hypothetical protein